jgi:hypothetical protein
MEETRRRFLIMLAASCTAAANGSVLAQTRKSPFPLPPPPGEQQNPAEAQAQAAKTNDQSAKRAALLQNEKEFRAEVARLYELANELKQEVEKTVTTEVFSLQMYKRTEEIEKVAKRLRAKAKGQ